MEQIRAMFSLGPGRSHWRSFLPADEKQLSPPKQTLFGLKISLQTTQDRFRLTQPLLIGYNFQLGHGLEGIELVPHATCYWITRRGMGKSQKWRPPRLYSHENPIFPQDPMGFRLWWGPYDDHTGLRLDGDLGDRCVV